MTHHPPPTHPKADEVQAAIQQWLQRAVLGLNLCPFAHEPVRHGRLRIQVSAATHSEDLLRELEEELVLLRDADPGVLETTLLVVPDMLADFDDYNDFLPIADLSVRMLGLDGVIQIASFHPEYRFSGVAPDDITNYSNRAPYPCLHLLREASISRAVAGMSDPDAIYRRNMAVLVQLGEEGWRKLFDSANHQ